MPDDWQPSSRRKAAVTTPGYFERHRIVPKLTEKSSFNANTQHRPQPEPSRTRLDGSSYTNMQGLNQTLPSLDIPKDRHMPHTQTKDNAADERTPKRKRPTENLADYFAPRKASRTDSVASGFSSEDRKHSLDGSSDGSKFMRERTRELCGDGRLGLDGLAGRGEGQTREVEGGLFGDDDDKNDGEAVRGGTQGFGGPMTGFKGTDATHLKRKHIAKPVPKLPTTRSHDGSLNQHKKYKHCDEPAQERRDDFIAKIEKHWPNTNSRAWIPMNLRPYHPDRLPNNPQDWSGELTHWLSELARITRGDMKRAHSFMEAATGGGPLGSQDVREAYDLCMHADGYDEGRGEQDQTVDSASASTSAAQTAAEAGSDASISTAAAAIGGRGEGIEGAEDVKEGTAAGTASGQGAEGTQQHARDLMSRAQPNHPLLQPPKQPQQPAYGRIRFPVILPRIPDFDELHPVRPRVSGPPASRSQESTSSNSSQQQRGSSQKSDGSGTYINGEVEWSRSEYGNGKPIRKEETKIKGTFVQMKKKGS